MHCLILMAIHLTSSFLVHKHSKLSICWMVLKASPSVAVYHPCIFVYVGILEFSLTHGFRISHSHKWKSNVCRAHASLINLHIIIPVFCYSFSLISIFEVKSRSMHFYFPWRLSWRLLSFTSILQLSFVDCNQRSVRIHTSIGKTQ